MWVRRNAGFVDIHEYQECGWVARICNLSEEAMRLKEWEWFELAGPIKFENGKAVIPTVKPRTVEDVKEEIVAVCLKALFVCRDGSRLSIKHPYDRLHRLTEELRAMQAKAGQ